MWTVVYIAQNKAEAEKMQQRLTREGFLVKIKPIGGSKKSDASSYEILVPAAEIDEAMEVINSF
ncbi:MAG: glutamate decarboxylase [Desulfotomaculum sp.]|nr:glutamate decarboxylase [Desulfotomaculum sp.]